MKQKSWMLFVPILLFFPVFGLLQYVKEISSPIMTASQWIHAIETRDAERIRQWTLWDGKPLQKEWAEELAETLHNRPEWKRKIYRDLQRQAGALARGKGDEAEPWFQLERENGSLSYKVTVPGLYIRVDAPFAERMTLETKHGHYRLAAQPVGPILPVEQELRLLFHTQLGDMEKKLHLSLEQIWGKEVFRWMPGFSYTVSALHSQLRGGDVYVDGRYLGKLEHTPVIGPVPAQPHRVHLRRKLPWGEVRSADQVLRPGQSRLEIPVSLVTSSLIEQLGNLLVRYNREWTRAFAAKDLSLLNSMTPELKESLSAVLAQKETFSFTGDFAQLVLYPSTLEIAETDLNHFRARVLVREDYIDGRWLSADGDVIETYPEHRYWRYLLEYRPETGWLVSGYEGWEGNAPAGDEGIAHHSGEVLRLGVDAGLYPFAFMDGDQQLAGFDVELSRWLGEELGIPVILEDRPWDQILRDLQTAKTLDGAVTGIEEGQPPESDRYVPTIPYLEMGGKRYVLLIRSDLSGLVEKVNQAIARMKEERRQEFQELVGQYFDGQDHPGVKQEESESNPPGVADRNPLR